MTPDERAKLENELTDLRREFNKVLLGDDSEPNLADRLEALRIRIANAKAVLAADSAARDD